MTAQTLTCSTCQAPSAFDAEPGEVWECPVPTGPGEPACGARNVVPGGPPTPEPAPVPDGAVAVPLTDEGVGTDVAG